MNIHDTFCKCGCHHDGPAKVAHIAPCCRTCPHCNGPVVEWAYRWHVDHCSHKITDRTLDDMHHAMMNGPRIQQALGKVPDGVQESIKLKVWGLLSKPIPE